MSGSTAKLTRREIRRAVGPSMAEALTHAQANISALANSVALAHQRITDLEQRIVPLDVPTQPPTESST